ncbi:MAG TPA: serine protease [Phycisphaerales bacterium]|nr:serine protease [Phycisphaerales bacterium]
MPNWNDVQKELQEYNIKAVKALDLVRRKYLTQLHKHTGRNIIAYYSGFLSKPNIVQSSINDEDKNGFMSAIHRLDKTKGLDLVLHTPGGNLAATESIVDYLRRIFRKDIRAIVPQIAMSAGTMMACSCKEIVMATHSCLGPIDPQLRDVPAEGVIQEFRRACREIKKDPSKIPLWQSIIGQYRPTFLSQCENAIQWSKEFVENQLKSVMFDGKPNSAKRAKKAVKELSDYSGNKAHDRHIHIDECRKIGLNVLSLEKDDRFQDLVLTVHHCYMHVFQNALAYKIIENHLGIALVKNVVPKRK